MTASLPSWLRSLLGLSPELAVAGPRRPRGGAGEPVIGAPGMAPSPGRALPWMSASLLAAVLPACFYLPLWGPMIFGACALWRWWIEATGRPLPPVWLRLVLFVVTVGTVFGLAGLSGSGAALGFLLILVSLKLLELRTRRDYIIVALLGYFLALCGFFYNQTLPLALYTAGTVVLNTLALAMACGATPTRALLRLALGLCAQTLPMVAVLYIFFPRVEGRLVLFSTGDKTALSGMNDRLAPGELARVVENDDVAFRVEFNDPTEVPREQMYWRGPVLALCNGLSWAVSGGRLGGTGFVPRAPVQEAPAAERLAPGARMVTQRITMEPHQHRWLFALDRPVGSPTRDTYLTVRGAVEATREVQRKLLYTAVSVVAPAPDAAVGRVALPGPEYLQLPTNLSPRVRELGARLRAQAQEKDAAIADALLKFFCDEGFRYTAQPGSYEGEGGLEAFLFRRKLGFCEHYSAAGATLARAAGVPARVVLGYLGGRLNWMGSHLSVRQSDAHAWCELWLAGRGWVRVDPTSVVAPDRLSLGAEGFNALEGLSPAEQLQALLRLNNPTGFRWLMRNAALAWDSLDHQWNLRVLGYDAEMQGDLLRDLGLGKLWWLGGAAGIAVGAGLLAASFALLLWMRGRSGRPANKREEAVRKIYDQFCRRVVGAGGPARVPSEGPRDFAHRAAAALPAEAVAIGAVTDGYVAARYELPGVGDALARLRAAARSFRPRRK